MPESPPAPTTTALPPLRETIARHGIAARRSLGQNFLLDLNLTRRIARAAGDLAGMTVIEVGPGPGGLTRALLETAAARVVAIERDPRCIAALAELAELHPDRLTIVEGDALSIDAATAGGADAAAAVFAVSAVYKRTTAKYGERGIRYAHMEAGHAAQNLLLQAVVLGLGSVLVGAFSDEKVRQVLMLNATETPLYLIPVGKA